MTRKQHLGFALSFLVFCVGASLIIYPMGAFDFGPQSFVVLGVAYAICGVLLYRYFREHPEAFDSDQRLTPSAELTYPLVATSMLGFLVNRLLSNGSTMDFLIPAVLCFVCIWAAFFTSRSNFRKAMLERELERVK